MTEFELILGMFLVTFGARYPALALVGRITLPNILVRALRYVPAAVLTAIIVPAVLIPDSSRLALHPNNPGLVAAVFSIFVAYRTKNLLWTIVIGMALFWAWRLLFI